MKNRVRRTHRSHATRKRLIAAKLKTDRKYREISRAFDVRQVPLRGHRTAAIIGGLNLPTLTPERSVEPRGYSD